MNTAEIISDLTDNPQVNKGVIEAFLQELPSKALSIGLKLIFCMLVIAVGMKLIGILRKMLTKSMHRAGAEHGVISFVDSFVKAVLYVILLFMILSWFGVNTASIVAVVGSAGVAVGLALQGSLSNFAGGVLILLLKPFKVGDYIKEDTHGNEGTVSDIQIFYTKLTTVDNKVIVLPNGDLANSSLTNMSANDTRRADVQVGIAYDADLKKAKGVLLDMLKKDDAVLKDKEIIVFVDNLADSAVILNLRCYFKQEDFWEGKWRITENAKLVLDAENIVIPFNQMDVHLFS